MSRMMRAPIKVHCFRYTAIHAPLSDGSNRGSPDDREAAVMRRGSSEKTCKCPQRPTLREINANRTAFYDILPTPDALDGDDSLAPPDALHRNPQRPRFQSRHISGSDRSKNLDGTQRTSTGSRRIRDRPAARRLRHLQSADRVRRNRNSGPSRQPPSSRKVPAVDAQPPGFGWARRMSGLFSSLGIVRRGHRGPRKPSARRNQRNPIPRTTSSTLPKKIGSPAHPDGIRRRLQLARKPCARVVITSG
jgi:hypothetical protein